MPTPKYTLTPFYSGGFKGVEIRLARDLSASEIDRAEALNRGVNFQTAPFGWDLTPVRARKWALLFDGGWLYDGRGFRRVAGGNQWTMRDAVAIEEDIALLRGSAT